MDFYPGAASAATPFCAASFGLEAQPETVEPIADPLTRPGPAEPAPVLDSVTILRPLLTRMRLAKEYSLAPSGQVVRRVWPLAKRYRAICKPVAGIHDLLAALQAIEPNPAVCIIRGEPIEGADLENTARKARKNGGAFADVPRRWVMLDLDHVRLPASASVLADPQDAARIVLDLVTSHVPELEGVSAVVQFSSSAGIGDLAEAEAVAGLPPRWADVVKPGAGIGAHIWFWLTEAVGEAELDRWAKAVNERVGDKLIDPATLRTVQPLFTAAPIFAAPLVDPLAGRRTWLIEGDADAATLDIPPIPARGAAASRTSGASGHASRGYQGSLDAIGPGGFHDPINSAIASFIATNWPDPDTAALKAALAERILAADPGPRPADAIARYASDAYLNGIIAWTMGREQDKRDALAAASRAAAAAPIAPTYPDRGVSLAEANATAAAAIAAFAARSAAGEAPQLLLKMTVGGGKTFAGIAALPDLIAAGRAAGRGPALFTHPRHDLGDQIAADIRKIHPGLRVAVWRGMSAADPDQPGNSMCQDLEMTRAAALASQGDSHPCRICPLAAECGYQRQAAAAQGADVFVVPHNMLFLTPFAAWPRVIVDGVRVPMVPSVVLVDESPVGAGLRGLDTPVQLALSALASDATPHVEGFERDRLLGLRRDALAALAGMPAGGVFREPLEWMRETPGHFGIGTMSAAREWSALEWKCKPRVRLAPGTSRDAAIAAYKEAAEEGFSSRRPRLAVLIADFLATGDVRSVNLEIDLEANFGADQGTGPAVVMAWREDFDPTWSAAPMLFLDATGRAEVLREWAPRLELVEIEVAAPHQHVVAVTDQEFGRAWLTQAASVKAVADALMVETARATGDTLAICQVAAESLLGPEIERRGGVRLPRPAEAVEPHGRGGKAKAPASASYRFPSGAVLHLAHHGAVTGINAWEKVATVVSIGRPAMNRAEGERFAEVIAGRAVTRVAGAEDSWWPAVAAAVRMSDGTGRAVRQPRHPDELVEAFRHSVTEGAVLQGIGRPRGVRRSAADPVRVVVLAALTLPLTVAEATTWDDYRPDRLAVAAAEAALFGRALPLAPADLATARPDLWGTEKAAARFLEGRDFETPQTPIMDSHRGLGGFKTLAPARYRRGLRGRWSSAMVPVASGRAALESLVGPLAAFELVEAARAVASTPEPIPAAAKEAPMIYLQPPIPGDVPSPRPAIPPPAVGAPPAAPRLRVVLSFHPEPSPPPPAILADASPIPAASIPDARARLADLSRRLDAVRPVILWKDEFDPLRIETWQARIAAARAVAGETIPPAAAGIAAA